MKSIILNENEIKEISKCLMLEAKTWEFRRGFGKPSKEEKFTVKLWKKFGDLLNQIAVERGKK